MRGTRGLAAATGADPSLRSGWQATLWRQRHRPPRL